jgi:hypothetical protein
MFKNVIKIFKKLLKKLKSRKGNSLAEFAVTTAMMATLATTAAPRFASIGESAKEKKTMANIDRIIAAANNHYMESLETEGRGRFPGQIKYNVPVGGIDLAQNQLTVDALEGFQDNILPGLTSADGDIGSYFVYAFALSSDDQDAVEQGILVSGANAGFDGEAPFVANELRFQFSRALVDSPYQDGAYILLVIPGSGTGTLAEPPALVVADMENPAKLHKILVP